MCVPSLVVAKVYLHQIDTSLNQLRCCEQAPTKCVLAIKFLTLFIRTHYVKSLARLVIRQQVHGHLSLPVKLLHLSRLFQKLTLFIQCLKELVTIGKSFPTHSMRQGQVWSLKF